jgi:hypothetical protein
MAQQITACCLRLVIPYTCSHRAHCLTSTPPVSAPLAAFFRHCACAACQLVNEWWTTHLPCCGSDRASQQGRGEWPGLPRALYLPPPQRPLGRRERFVPLETWVGFALQHYRTIERCGRPTLTILLTLLFKVRAFAHGIGQFNSAFTSWSQVQFCL